MKKVGISVSVILFCFILSQSCSKFEPGAPEDDGLLDGPVEGLSFEQKQRFLAGDFAFNDEIFTTSKGLGPLFVATSCGSCHAGDGKGHPFTTLIRFGQIDSTGNQYLHLGGPQLQNRAISGFVPEQIPSGATFSKFTPPANTGLGFLEAVSDNDILALVDPNDLDGDGISGTVSWCNIPTYILPHQGAVSNNGRYIGRFGKKAGSYNLLHQTVNAYNQDMGIASSYNPIDIYTNMEIEPEVATQTINNVVFYLKTLKVPPRRNIDDPRVQQGQTLFAQIGCESCHKSTMQTGYSVIEPLSYKEFHPYTDLLLHDMGAGLDDGYTEGSALTSEWRTPALWGLGLSVNSQGGQYYLMHDGRAHSIEAAIILHGGEATASKSNFTQLTPDEKSLLMKFLESL